MYRRKFFFGKHKNEFILDVIETDVQYISWCLDNVDFLKFNETEMQAYRNKINEANVYMLNTTANRGLYRENSTYMTEK